MMKTLNSGNVISISHIPNDYKGVVFQNETTSISSPARRSEISPIQNHVRKIIKNYDNYRR